VNVISISEVVVTFIILIILVYILIIIFIVIFDSFFFIGIFFMLKASHIISWFPLLAETILSLSHLIVLTVTKHGLLVISIIIEYFFLFVLLLFPLEGFNDILLFLPSLRILEVVHVKLMLQVINVGELLYIDSVEFLQLSFQSFILFLILWLYVFKAF